MSRPGLIAQPRPGIDSQAELRALFMTSLSPPRKQLRKPYLSVDEKLSQPSLPGITVKGMDPLSEQP